MPLPLGGMLTGSVCYALIADALDAAGVGLALVERGRVARLNRTGRELLCADDRPGLIDRPLLEAIGDATGLAEWDASLWLAKARAARTPMRTTVRPFEARLCAPLLAAFPETDALLLWELRAPHQARLAHDLANLMQGVAAGLSVLALRSGIQDEPLDRRDLAEIAELSSRAIALARRLGAPPRPSLSASDVHLERRLEDTARALLGPRLRWYAAGPIPPIPLAADEWESVVLNLLFNARDASQEDDPIEVTTSIDEGHLVLAVRDHGRGMDEATVARATEAGFSTKSTSTGMGLSHVAQLLARVGGSVELTSEPGVGTTATVRVPRLRGPDRVP